MTEVGLQNCEDAIGFNHQIDEEGAAQNAGASVFGDANGEVAATNFSQSTCEQPDPARINSSMRDHCLNSHACKAAKPTTHCQSCNMKHLWQDPAFRVNHAARLREKFANDPEFLARHREAGSRNMRAYHADPANKATVSARAIANLPKMNSPEVIARRLANKDRMIQRLRETKLAWCPRSRWDDYINLLKKGFKAREARRMILADVESAPRRVIARITAEMLAKEERRKREAY